MTECSIYVLCLCSSRTEPEPLKDLAKALSGLEIKEVCRRADEQGDPS